MIDMANVGKKICGVLLLCIGFVAALATVNAFNEEISSRILPSVPPFVISGILAAVCIFLGLKLMLNKGRMKSSLILRIETQVKF